MNGLGVLIHNREFTLMDQEGKTQPNCLQIAVDYLIRDRNQPANLVFPFYLK